MNPNNHDFRLRLFSQEYVDYDVLDSKDDKYVDSDVLDSKDDDNVHLVNGKTEGKGDEHSEVVPKSKSKSKSKKKKSGSSKEKKDTVLDSFNQMNDLKGDKMQQNEENTNNVDDKSALEAVAIEGSVEVPLNEVKTKKKKKEKKVNATKADDENHIDDVLVVKDDEKPNDMGVGNSIEVLASGEVVMAEDKLKPMKKRKTRGEVNTDATGNKEGDDCKELANGNNSEEKKLKRKGEKQAKHLMRLKET